MSTKDSFISLLETNKKNKRLKIHSFHRYYGKLIPAIPRTSIELYSKEGDIVFDPFSGSATTGVEALNLNRKYVGAEINPLSCLVTNAKLESYDINVLNTIYDNLCNLLNNTTKVSEKDKPWCVNREHWFDEKVQCDLIEIEKAIHKVTKGIKDDRKKYNDFLLVVLSSIIRQVSFADTMHVFPGVSKRMKKLIENNELVFDTKKTYLAALKKRISYVKEFKHENDFKILNIDSTIEGNLSEYNNSIDLVVTNPPYISSVRYAETLKLELYWMRVCLNSSEFRELASSMTGSDYYRTSEVQNKEHTGYKEIDKLIDKLFEIDKKQAYVVYKYFNSMEKVIIKMQQILKSGKKFVIKIGNSKIRGVTIPTGHLLVDIALKNGFKLDFIFNDKINPNSRSLTTARNSYSDIILEDNIIVLERL